VNRRSHSARSLIWILRAEFLKQYLVAAHCFFYTELAEWLGLLLRQHLSCGKRLPGIGKSSDAALRSLSSRKKPYGQGASC
jgi:hypothetical protein